MLAHRLMQNCNISGAAPQRAHLDYFGLTILMFYCDEPMTDERRAELPVRQRQDDPRHDDSNEERPPLYAEQPGDHATASSLSTVATSGGL